VAETGRQAKPEDNLPALGNGDEIPAANAELDWIDLGIIQSLQDNGRATNLEIAEALAISPATVSARIRRLEETHAMRVVAVTDFAAHGLNILIAVGVQVHGRRAEDVARELAEFPEVFSINLMTGSYDLEMLVALREFEDVNVFLYEHVANVTGVHRLDAGLAVDVIKFQFKVGPL
jgi:Lrp/AsnC family transcriptional regulator for asnA, asnC and gidA